MFTRRWSVARQLLALQTVLLCAVLAAVATAGQQQRGKHWLIDGIHQRST